MTADATIDYDDMQQDALRGLVRSVLVRVAKSGLPGEHHLYISFDVRAPGVILSKRLREKYPSEMTIVLQHRFWDLAVSDERFEVKLTFDGIPERLVVPFSAIKVFLDPSVRYVLHFEELASLPETGLGRTDLSRDEARPSGPRSLSPKKPRATKGKSRNDQNTGSDSVVNPTVAQQPTRLTKPASLQSLPKTKTPSPALAPSVATSLPSTNDEKGPPEQGKPASNASAQVVSLDAFRKK